MSDLYRYLHGDAHPDTAWAKRTWRRLVDSGNAVPVEPVGTLTSTAGGTGRITYDVDTDGLVLPEGEYMIVPKGADDE